MVLAKASMNEIDQPEQQQQTQIDTKNNNAEMHLKKCLKSNILK